MLPTFLVDSSSVRQSPSPSTDAQSNMDAPPAALASKKKSANLAAAVGGLLVGLAALAVLGAVMMRRRRRRGQINKLALASSGPAGESRWADVKTLKDMGAGAAIVSSIGKAEAFHAKRFANAKSSVNKSNADVTAGSVNPVASSRAPMRTVGGASAPFAMNADGKAMRASPGSSAGALHKSRFVPVAAGAVATTSNPASPFGVASRTPQASPFNRGAASLAGGASHVDAPKRGPTANPLFDSSRKIAKTRTDMGSSLAPSDLTATDPKSLRRSNSRPDWQDDRKRSSAIGRRRTMFGPARPRALGDDGDISGADMTIFNQAAAKPRRVIPPSLSAPGSSSLPSSALPARHLNQADAFRPASIRGIGTPGARPSILVRK
jgi:hypothetical protein